MKPDTEKNLDVLQNIELRIIDVYRADPSLLDLDVKDAMDSLVRHYRAEEEQRSPPALQLHVRAQRVFSNVHCLKKIQKSVPFWSEEGGSQGYLKFVNQYIR